MVTLLIVIPVLLTHLNSRPGNTDSLATSTGTAVLTRTDQVTSADVIKMTPDHGRGVTAGMEAAGPAPTDKPVSTTTKDQANKKQVITFGDKSGPGKLQRARGVAVSPDNKIWVADRAQPRLQVYSMGGAHLYHFPQGSAGLGYSSKEPQDVSIDRDGHLWVLMSGYPTSSDAVAQFDRKGHLRANFDLPGTVPRIAPRGMAVGLRNNHVFVTWSGGYSGGVQAFQPDGKCLWEVGPQQRMMTPMNVAVNGDGNIFVSDFNTHFIYIYDENGQFVKMFGGPGRSDSNLSHPQGIGADSSGHIMVVDDSNQRVVVYTDRGEYVRHIAVHVKLPTRVAVGPGGQLVVINYNTITVFPRY
ncbi:PREDICTED: tripartite motif-containing protein 2-like [Branchiostoma belcheri]|uniref:Tripartite motif-containing protein 2-like n=1 Tax=Branchiostoma belcheri TaxID=7741 RepID=A0A6P4XJD2_BRABE|nr:PREDICTED: tripartite motif-containing protein 2-like [Branchiostoma belcheri]